MEASALRHAERALRLGQVAAEISQGVVHNLVPVAFPELNAPVEVTAIGFKYSQAVCLEYLDQLVEICLYPLFCGEAKVPEGFFRVDVQEIMLYQLKVFDDGLKDWLVVRNLNAKHSNSGSTYNVDAPSSLRDYQETRHPIRRSTSLEARRACLSSQSEYRPGLRKCLLSSPVSRDGTGSVVVDVPEAILGF